VPNGNNQSVGGFRTGTARANEVAEQTLWQARQTARFDFFARTILFEQTRLAVSSTLGDATPNTRSCRVL
jgi:hypothetical protein